MERNWWLWGQTLGITGMATLAWRVTGLLEEREHWQNPDDLKIKSLPPVSIIVPARNEERNIERCARSLLQQFYPNFELVVVDDGSTDRTPEILKRLAEEYSNLKIVRLDGTLPEGWSGKVHAMYEGVKAARPESAWFLFSDADTLHAPSALGKTVACALNERADLLSILGTFEMVTLWEKMLMPIAVFGIALQYPVDQVNSPRSKLAIANGQFLLIRRRAYERVGGWEALKHSILDDRDMAMAVKQSGAKLALHDGRDLLQVRMYTNFWEIWHGWRKNAFVGSRGAYVMIPLFILAGILLGILPFLQVPYAVLKYLAPGNQGQEGRESAFRLLTHSLFQTGVMLSAKRRLDHSLGLPTRYSFLFPVGTMVFLGILLDSMWRSIRGGGVNWKGRLYEDPARTQNMIS